MIHQPKNFLGDTVFLLSVMAFIVILFAIVALINVNPPPLPFNSYGMLILPQDPSIITNSTMIKGQTKQDNNSVKFYKITVRHAETLSLIALQRQMRIDTLLSVNKFNQLEQLKAGQSIIIPDRDGIIHKVRRRDNLDRLSVEYHQTKKQIMLTNDLATEKLFIGQELFMEDAQFKSSQLNKIINNALVFPLAGVVRTFYGSTTNRLTGLPQHNDGIDISTIDGQDVLSAAPGFVSESGFHPTYGYYLIISHDNGLQTFYGYLASLTYKKGTKIERGQKIGTVGRSGVSNGGLLHFSVFKEGANIDPLLYLK